MIIYGKVSLWLGENSGIFFLYFGARCRVVRCRSLRSRGQVVGSNPTRVCCAPSPTQRAIPPGSVSEYQRKLGSKRTYHATHCPVSVVVRLRLVSGWGLLNGDQCLPMGLWGSGKDFTFFYFVASLCHSLPSEPVVLDFCTGFSPLLLLYCK